MIVSFSVSNFRSYSSEETLSLVASKRLSARHKDHETPIPDSDEHALKTAVLYGANGAGKSNLFKALRYLKSIATKTRKKNSGTGRDVFRFNDDADQPSIFDLQFIAAEKLYRFGIKVNDQRVMEEWLVRVVGGREKPLYERITDTEGDVKIEMKGIKDAGQKLKALATVGGPQNQSFLSTIQATLDTDDFGNEMSEVISWFREDLKLIAPDESFGALAHLLSDDEKFLEFAGNFLKASSTGIDHLDVVKKAITEEELQAILPKNIWSDIRKKLNDDDSRAAFIQLDEGNELHIEQSGGGNYYSLSVQASHQKENGDTAPLELTEESDGTRRLLNLIPALHHLLSSNAVYFIDEVDRSMHPMLVWKFLEFFLTSCKDGRNQIIVTTHESNLLDLDLLRRDEIWFTEKDKTGSSRLYSLADYKIRNDLEIRKHYLQGRFGAVPFLGSIDRLLQSQDC